MDGAGTQNRTADLLITNQSLYQLSYSGAEDAEAYRDPYGLQALETESFM